MIKKENIKLWVIVFLLLVIIINFIWVFFSSPLKVEIVPVKFIIGDRLGFDVNSSELTYGIILKGNSGVRKLIIENNYSFPVIVRLYVSSEISDYIYSENNLIIDKNEQIKLPVILRVPNDIEYGNYTGKIRVEFRKYKGEKFNR